MGEYEEALEGVTEVEGEEDTEKWAEEDAERDGECDEEVVGLNDTEIVSLGEEVVLPEGLLLPEPETLKEVECVPEMLLEALTQALIDKVPLIEPDKDPEEDKDRVPLEENVGFPEALREIELVWLGKEERVPETLRVALLQKLAEKVLSEEAVTERLEVTERVGLAEMDEDSVENTEGEGVEVAQIVAEGETEVVTLPEKKDEEVPKREPDEDGHAVGERVLIKV